MKKLIFLGLLTCFICSANCLTEKQKLLLNFIDNQERTAKIITFIKMLNIDVNFFDEYDGNTPLHLAAVHGNLTLVKFLMKRGARVDVENYNKQTPIHEIIINTRFKIEDATTNRTLNPVIKKFLKTTCKKILILLLQEGNMVLSSKLAGDSILLKCAISIGKEVSTLLENYLRKSLEEEDVLAKEQ